MSVVKYAGLDKPDEGSVYWPMAGRATVPIPDTTVRFRYLLVRTKSNPEELAPAIGVSDVATIDELVERSVEMPRSLSGSSPRSRRRALLLSSVGIYGVMSHHVQHARDMCIRLALGGARD